MRVMKFTDWELQTLKRALVIANVHCHKQGNDNIKDKATWLAEAADYAIMHSRIEAKLKGINK